ncbi:MAG: hypothetical protein HQK50_17845 [Oligoflexia bacterium]|nr:hypothetical protein [Oligoflexia bacterium]MBF0367441.1 hypothetical protein [Oligoflexia bacterium]
MKIVMIILAIISPILAEANGNADALYEQHLEKTKVVFERELSEGRSGNEGAESFVRVLYWPNMNMGFGHVALEIFQGKLNPTPTRYLSYAMGNNLKVDLQKHGILPEIITLPFISDQTMQNFISWFDHSSYSTARGNYGSDYALITHNCAHAIFYSLRELSYDIWSSCRLCTPKKIRSMSKELAI